MAEIKLASLGSLESSRVMQCGNSLGRLGVIGCRWLQAFVSSSQFIFFLALLSLLGWPTSCFPLSFFR